MSRLLVPTIVFLTVVISACSDRNDPVSPTSSGPPISFASGKPRGGGFDNANNVGSVPGSQWGPDPWTFTADVEAFGTVCWDQGFCAVGDLINPDIPLNNVLDLGVNSNPDPNPATGCLDALGQPSVKCYALLSTSNFQRDTSDNNITDPVEIHTLRSGIQTSFDLAPSTGWVLEFDYAFMSSTPTASPSTNSYAAVYLDYDSDGNGTLDKTVTAFQVFRSNLEQGTIPLKAGGCGTGVLGGITSSYPLCTGWQSAQFNASSLAGKKVQVRIVADEGGIDPGVATSLAIDNLKFEETVLVGTVSASPNPVQVSSPVTLNSTFTDTELGITHTATITWGDGTTSAGLIVEPTGTTPGSVTGSHSYASTGAYPVNVAVSDGSGANGQASTTVTVVPASLKLDILPGISPNRIFLRFNLPIPVVLYGSATFDVRTVAVSSLRFGPLGAHAVLNRAILFDVNRDGFLDQISSYLTRQTGIRSGDTQACLSGKNNNVPFQVCDAITTVP